MLRSTHALRRSIITIGLLIVSFVLLPLQQTAFSAVNLPYNESFVDTDGDNETVDGWNDSDGAGFDAKLSTSEPRPGSATPEHARLRLDASITQVIDTSGFDAITLSYYWRGDNDAEASDLLRVRWRVTDSNNPNFSASFTELTSHPLNTNTSTWSSIESHNLPQAASHTTIEIQFFGDTNVSSEEARIDDVSVTGTAFTPASVSIDKITDPAGDPQSFEFTLTGPVSVDTVNVTDTTPTTTVSDLLPGTYTLVETVPGGWDLTSISCNLPTTPIANGVSFTLGEDEHISCSFTDTKRGSITVEKQVLSPNGFDPADATLFTALLDGGLAQQFTEASSTVYANLLPGTYNISESSNALYTFTSFSEDDNSNPADGAQITISPGEGMTLLITNNQQPGTFVIAKNVFAPDSTTNIIDPHPFTITLTGTQGHATSSAVIEGSDVTFFLDPGVDYTVSEAADNDYTQLGCFRDDAPVSCANNVASGSSLFFEFRNAQKNGSIAVEKDVLNPDGNAVDDDAEFTVSMNSDQKTVSEGSPTTYADLAPGTYTIEEIVIPQGYDFGSFSLDEDGNASGAQITIGSNESVTLIVTNMQQKGTIRVLKDVIGFDGNDIGDNNPFTATVAGQPHQTFAENDPAEFLVNPGTHTVDEFDHPNYDFVDINPPDGAVIVTPGGLVEVSIRNRPSAGNIIVKKIIQGPTGQPDLSDDASFTATVTGQPNQPFSQTADAVFMVGPGQYTVGEADFPGYDLMSVSPPSVFVTSGATSTVTITNRQRSTTIIVEKNVLDPDSGEVSDAIGFPVSTDDGQNGIVTELLPLTLTGVTPFAPVTVSEGDVPGYDLDSPKIAPPMNPGATTTVSFINRQRKARVTVTKDVKNPEGNLATDNHSFEVSVGNQTQSFAEDSPAEFFVNPGMLPIVETPDPDYLPDPNNQDEVTVVPGATTTVTLVNFQKRGKIEIIKDVLNPDLGPVSDATPFTVTLEGVGSQPFMEGTTTTFDNLLPGMYSLTELAPSTHDLVGFSPDSTVTVGSNETAIVTVTNRQHPATIIVHKNVVGPDGETEVEDPHIFSVSVDGNGGTKPVSEETSAMFTVYPGTRTITELPDANYLLHNISPSSTVTILPDQTIEITITNKPRLAMIKVNKFVQDVSDATTTDEHVFTVNAGSNSLPLVAGTQTVFTLLPGFYTVSESPDPGYDIINGSPTNINVGPGQSTTVNIVNRQRRGKIVVVKNVIGPNGEEVSDPTAFQIQFNGNPDTPVAEGQSATFDELPPGTYTLTETQGTGYEPGALSTTTPIVLDPGETVEVIITNKQLLGSISGMKWKDTNGDGVRDQSEPGIESLTIVLGRVTGPETPEGHIPIEIVALSLTSINGSFIIPRVTPGQYKLLEEQRGGWVPTAPPMVDSFFDITYRIDLLPQQVPLTPDSFFDVFVDPGQQVETGMPSGCQPILLVGCALIPLEFGNFELGSIAGMKWNDLNGDGVHDNGEPGLENWEITLNPGNVSTTTDENGTYSFEGLTAGTFTVAEVQNLDWDQTFPINPGTHVVEINSGTNSTDNDFGNRLRLGRIIIEKQTLPDQDPQQFEFIGHPAGIVGDDGELSEDVEPGQYQSTETIPQNWMIASMVCNDTNSSGDPQTGVVTFNVEPGETVRCIITNKKATHITVSKTSVGDVGTFHFRGSLEEFDITTVQPNILVDSFFDVFVDIAGEDLSVSEDVPDGWSIDQQTCALAGVLPGDERTCSFTNTKLGTLIIVKETVGGDAIFTFDHPTTTATFDLTTVNGRATTTFELPAGTNYDVTEQPLAGWDITLDPQCQGTLDPGEETFCVFANTKRGHLIVQKITDPSGDSTEFPITASGTGIITDGSAGTVTDALDKDYEVTPGTYSVHENIVNQQDIAGLPDWFQTSNDCNDIIIGPGETVTCTIVNTKKASVTVTKQTIGGDGTFSFTATGGNGVAPFNVTTAGGTGAATLIGLVPGIYQFAETPQEHWGEVSSTCDEVAVGPGESASCTIVNKHDARIMVSKTSIGGIGSFEFAGDLGALALTTAQENSAVDSFFDVFVDVAGENLEVTEDPISGWSPNQQICSLTNVQPGASTTCEFVNTKLGKIIVDKITNPNDDLQPFAFSPSWGDQFSLTDANPPHDSGFLAPDTYSIAETVPAGWDLTSATCSDESSPNAIQLDAGETVICTFTNTKRGTLTVVKETAGGDETFTFDHPTSTATFALTTVNGRATTTFELPAGTHYEVNEQTVPQGWDEASNLVCQGAIAAGGNVECRFINVKRPQITVIKEVINTGGGTKAPADFTLHVQGQDFPGSTNGTTLYLAIGAYAVTETPDPDYTTSFTENCTGTIAAGATTMCTVTNTFKTGTIEVVKKIVPESGGEVTVDDGDAGYSDTGWSFASGQGNDNDVRFIAAGDGTETAAWTPSMPATGQYDVYVSWTTHPNRATDAPYTANHAGGPSHFSVNQELLADQSTTGTAGQWSGWRNLGIFTLNAGSNVVLGNNANEFVIADAVRFVPVNDPGLFNLQINGATVASNSGHNGTTGTTTVSVNTHTVGETAGTDTTLVDYQTAIECRNAQDQIVASGNNAGPLNVSVGFGDVIVCTITNTRNGKLTIIKNTVGGDTTFIFTHPTSTDTFPLTTVSGTAQTSFDLPSGTAYNVTEIVPAGWDLTGNPNCQGTLAPGEQKICTFTNTKRGTITIEKKTLPDGDPAALTFIGNPAGAVSDGETISEDVVPGQYQSTEAIPPGWMIESIVCDDTDSTGDPQTGVVTFNVAAGGDVRCVVTNKKAALITVHKTSVGGAGSFPFTGDLGPFDLITALSDTPVSTTSEVFVPASGQTLTITENVPNGWSVDQQSCVLEDVMPGEERTCEFVNTKLGSITIVKNAEPDDPQDFEFTGPRGTFFLDDDQDGALSNATTTGDLLPGTYTIEEITPPEWDLIEAICDGDVNPSSIDLNAGQHITCTFTNHKNGAIRVIKTVVNDDGGTLNAVAFTIHVQDEHGADVEGSPAPGSATGADYSLIPGTYQVSEDTPPDGYTETSTECVGNGGPEDPGAIILDPGELVTCTITNDDQPATITVMKHVINDNGGNASTTDFTLLVNTTPVGNGDPHEVLPGSHVVSETGPGGYTATYSSDCDSQGNITVALGEHKTCTITNDDSTPSVKLIKAVTNNNGGTATPQEFDLLLGGVEIPSGVTTTVEANIPIEITELSLTGYSFVSITGDAKCPSALGGTVALDEGEHVECTITNDDQPASITVVKQVINDHGGTATTSDFVLFLDGQPVTSSSTTAVLPGNHTVSEANLTGYTATFGGDCDADGNVTVALGEHKTCTMTNDDQSATVTVVKQIVNDNGGQLQTGDFPLFLDGQPVTSGTSVNVSAGTHLASETNTPGYRRSFSGACSVESWNLAGLWALDFILDNDSSHRFHAMNVTSFNSGSGAFSGTGSTTGTVPPPAVVLYTWTMTGTETSNNFTMTIAYNEIPGYTVALTGTLDGSGGMTGTWADNGSATGTFTGTGAPEPLTGKLAVGVGESATCTIANDDLPSILRVKKVLPNDNGGTATPDQFSFSINGGDPLQFEPDGQNDLIVSAGEYDIVETSPLTGYAVSYQNCENVAIPNGGDAACTITNDDQPTTLTVEKIIINNNGGTATTSDFALTIDDGQVTHGVANPITAGPHTVGEDAFAGYSGAIGGDCALDGTITLHLGDQKTCTITNDDHAARITVVKQVVNDNGGAKQVADFPLFIDGNPTTSSTTVEVLPGAHIVSETSQAGYTTAISGDCDINGNVTVALGAHKICTLVNDDFQASLKIIKIMVNDDFGIATPSQFSFLVGTTPVAHNQTVPLNAGVYAITESGPAGYALTSYSTDCAGGSVTLALGDTKTCTIINDDIEVYGSVAGFKWLDRDEDGVKDLSEPYLSGWTITLSPDGRATTTDANGAYSFDNVVPGTHTVAEVMQAGWHQTYPAAPGTYSITITGAGEYFTGRNFGNVLPPSVSGVKFEDTNGNGVREQGEPLLPAWTIRLRNLSTNVTITTTTDANGAYLFANLIPGISYRVSEVLKIGWVQTMPTLPGTYTVTLQNGDTAIDRDFGNFRLAEIRGLKYHDINGNGQKSGSEPGLSGWTIFLDTNNNGALNGGEPSVTTGAGGTFSFGNLGPGTYRVREFIPSGWGQSQPGPLNGLRYEVMPQSGEVVSGANFGNYQFAEVHGRKYQDNNMNGTRNTGENFLSGWTIVLTHLNSGQMRNDVTDAQGRYDFVQLAPGNYQVREILKAGWVPTSPRDTIHRITIISGQNAQSLNFGNVTVAQFGGQQVTSQTEGEPIPLTAQEQTQQLPQDEQQTTTTTTPEIIQDQTEPQSPIGTDTTAPSLTMPLLPNRPSLSGPGLLNTNLENRMDTLRTRR